MSRSSHARRISITDVDRRDGAAPDPATPRIHTRLRRLNEDWIAVAPGLDRHTPGRAPAPPRRRRARLWPLIPLLAAAGIGLALRQAMPWIDREDARLGTAMARSLHLDCLGSGHQGTANGPPACH